jgi:hypothetical protein
MAIKYSASYNTSKKITLESAKKEKFYTSNDDILCSPLLGGEATGALVREAKPKD